MINLIEQFGRFKGGIHEMGQLLMVDYIIFFQCNMCAYGIR
jgi:hypothetical protein